MHLENIVIDAADPRRVGSFWQEALGTEQLTDEAEGFETRLHLAEAGFLDLCFPRVPDAGGPQSVHLDLSAGEDQNAVVSRLRELGAEDLDIGQGEVSWTVLSDPGGAAFCVLEPQEIYADSGPVAAIALQVADPQREAAFWSWISGWEILDLAGQPGAADASLRHPSGVGPLLEMCVEGERTGEAKSRVHLDVRLDAGDDMEAVAAGIADRGGREIDPGWGELRWRVFEDPAGNILCVLPAAAG